jgi:peptide/nickel transport system ATP-binding protein
MEDPVLGPGPTPGHSFACFHPVGTPEGDEALRANVAAGRTASGLDLEATISGVVG